MIFVTGGTGLLGSHLLLELTVTDEPITAIYRDVKKRETVRKLFRFYLKDDEEIRFQKINWVVCDVLDVPRLSEVMQGHSVVYHCAAIVSFQRKDFHRLIEVNRYGTANIVNLCLDLNVSKLCYVSSTAAVGSKGVRPSECINESGTFEVDDNTSGYSISKWSAEKEVWRGVEEGLNAVIINPSVIVGAGDWNESSMVIFRTIANGLRFYSPGSNAFVDARDVVKAMVMLTNSDISGQRFLCTGENLPFRDLFTQIAKELGKRPPKYPVSRLLMGVAWRLSVFFSAITFRSPAVTKSSAQSAFSVKCYDSSKLMKALDFHFTPINDAVIHAVKGKIN